MCYAHVNTCRVLEERFSHSQKLYEFSQLPPYRGDISPISDHIDFQHDSTLLCILVAETCFTYRLIVK